MTEAQWIFSYMEVKENEEKKNKDDIFKFMTLIKNIRIAGISSHKDINIESMINKINDIRMPGEKTAEEEAQDLIQYVHDNADIFPEEIDIVIKKEENNNVPKGKLDRKLGIIIPE